MKKLYFCLIICLSFIFISCSATKSKYITKEVFPEQNAEMYKIYVQEDETIPAIYEYIVIHTKTNIWTYQENFYPLGRNADSVVKGKWNDGVKVSGIKEKNGVVISMTMDGKTYKVK